MRYRVVFSAVRFLCTSAHRRIVVPWKCTNCVLSTFFLGNPAISILFTFLLFPQGGSRPQCETFHGYYFLFLRVKPVYEFIYPRPPLAGSNSRNDLFKPCGLRGLCAAFSTISQAAPVTFFSVTPARSAWASIFLRYLAILFRRLTTFPASAHRNICSHSSSSRMYIMYSRMIWSSPGIRRI